MPAYDVKRNLHVKLGGDWSSYLQPIAMTAHMIADQCWEEPQEDLAEVLATPLVKFKGLLKEQLLPRPL